MLAGDPAAGTHWDFPDQVTYVAGADIAVNTPPTFAFDLLGRYVIDAKRLTSETFHALDGTSTFPNIGFEDASFSRLNGSLGVKANMFGPDAAQREPAVQPRHAWLA